LQDGLLLLQIDPLIGLDILHPYQQFSRHQQSGGLGHDLHGHGHGDDRQWLEGRIDGRDLPPKGVIVEEQILG
jgi:hypothetical protein